jgi:carboxymethylenebutenolidase
MPQRTLYRSPSGDVEAAVARPPAGGPPWPALLLVHDVFGLVSHFEKLADRFAAEGYYVLAPELYSHDAVRKTLDDKDIERAIPLRNAIQRQGADLEETLAKQPEERRDALRRTLHWLMHRDSSTCFPDLEAGLAHLAAQPDVRSDRIGAIGYCRGGTLVGALAASGAPLAAAVIYYGASPPAADVPKIRCAIQGHYGGEDPTVTSTVPPFAEAMAACGKSFEQHVYAGARHAFFSDDRPTYHAEAARIAWPRTVAFLAAHLGKP